MGRNQQEFSMPILDNPKLELFCQHLAQGESQTKAYVSAGYKHDRRNASRLARTNDDVSARVKEIQAAGAQRAGFTVEQALTELEEARAAAMASGQYAAAVSAVREKGVFSGVRVERAEQGKPGEFEKMSIDELREYLFNELAALRVQLPPDIEH
jgi:hypothetical protein